MASAFRKLAAMVLAGVFLAACGNPACAALIAYHESVTGSGVLNGTSFSNSLITLTGTGDTDNVFTVNSRLANLVSMSVDVAGVGSATLTGDYYFFGQVHFGGFSRGIPASAGSTSVIQIANSAFTAYDLKSDLGPLPGLRAFAQNTQFATGDGGFLQMTSANNDARFLAQVTAVPEPSSVAIACVAGVGLLLARKRLGRAA
ncbi:hypothetical protein [Singulisphaera sp. PoT]|uniref:hypothetical protein n=1 Tax=Singulisphaera sp. PoT TaxID=3411797 RepID=UPI003BF4C512